MLVELAGLSTTAVYHLMTQVIVPRPIAWVVSDNGTEPEATRWNLAPFSYFNAVASEPPTVMFSVSPSRRGDGRSAAKDTLENVMLRPEHTIAIAARSQIDAVEASSADVPPGTSEFPLAGIEPVAWDWSVPRPAGAPVALGCTVDRIVTIADGPQRVVLSRVERIWVDDAACGHDQKGRLQVDPTLLDPLLRLGAGQYGRLGAPLRPVAPAHRR